MARWAQEYLGKAVKPSTAKRYLLSVRQLDPHFRGLFLDQITKRTIADYVAARTKAGATNATIRRDLTALSTILECANTWGWLEANPAKDYNRRVIRERREPIRPPTDAQVGDLIARCPKGFGDVIKFLSLTGMRQAEALTLTWADIDFQAGTITLRKTKTSRPRTIDMETVVGLATSAIKSRPRHISSPFVFWHGEGQPYRNFASRFKQYVNGKKGQKPLEFRCHDLRHKFAIDWLKAGGGIYDLSRHLGHSSVKTTEIYLAYTRSVPDYSPAQKIGSKE